MWGFQFICANDRRLTWLTYFPVLDLNWFSIYDPHSDRDVGKQMTINLLEDEIIYQI